VAHLLQHNPERVYLLGKKEEHIQEAENELKNYGDISRIHSVRVELEDLHQTDKVARKLASEITQLDALVLNAGLGVGVYNETTDGIDSHFQVNVVAQHHLMMMLLPILAKTPDSRVVFQSSEFHRLGTGSVEFQHLAEINQDVGAANLYNRTKLAQVCLAKSLVAHKQKAELGLRPDQPPYFIAVHPGGVNTNQPTQAEAAYGTKGRLGVKAVRPFMKDPVDEGCRPALFAATSDDVVKEQLDGCYIVSDRKVTDPSSNSKDEGLQERCLKLTETLLAEKLGELPYPTIYASAAP
jgi:WW domain-containing oxidoreductase